LKGSCGILFGGVAGVVGSCGSGCHGVGVVVVGFSRICLCMAARSMGTCSGSLVGAGGKGVVGGRIGSTCHGGRGIVVGIGIGSGNSQPSSAMLLQMSHCILHRHAISGLRSGL